MCGIIQSYTPLDVELLYSYRVTLYIIEFAQRNSTHLSVWNYPMMYACYLFLFDQLIFCQITHRYCTQGTVDVINTKVEEAKKKSVQDA